MCPLLSPEILQSGAVKGLTSIETTRLIRDGKRVGKGVRRWGKRDLYTYRYTVTTIMILAFRWAPMRAILIFH